MSGSDSRSADFFDLGAPFALDFGQFQFAAGDFEQKLLGTGGEFASIVDQGCNGFRTGEGRAIAEVQMDADAHGGQCAGDVYAVVEGFTIRDEGSAGDDAVAVGFGDAAIDACRPAQIIRVYD